MIRINQTILLFIAFSLCLNSKAQTIISKFTWNNGPVTVAAIGPNGTSVSTSAVSSNNGTLGTRGLNAGLPKQDIQLVIPGSPTFNVNGIDVSFDYQRDESVGDFWSRGSSLIISGCSDLSVSYRVSNGAGGFNTVNSGNVYAIPSDDIFRRYRFIYLPSTGYGYLLVNGTVVWSNDGPDNRNMYWTGSGNVIIGNAMDGNGDNKTFLDSMVVASVVNSALPVELLDFNVNLTEKNEVQNIWSTATERNNDYFTLERSSDGYTWDELTRVKGSGNSTSVIEYSFLDESPLPGISYYRLTQTDFDGKSETFDIRSVSREIAKSNFIYPNPCKDLCYLLHEEGVSIRCFSINGKDCTDKIEFTQQSELVQMNITALPRGVYFIFASKIRYKLVKIE